ncbi:MAG: hypothetical protein K8F58_15035 [Bauldia sp.]|nr:hypothetical protein [Bauldia sp.]
MTVLPDPDITLDVDLRNPGQFFACCGVLELAGRLWPGSAENGWKEPEGWFGDGVFHVATYRQSNELPIRAILNWLISTPDWVSRANAEIDYDEKVYPIRLATKLPLVLDWWLRQPWSTDSSTFKFWAAHQHPTQIVEELRVGLAEALTAVEDNELRGLWAMQTPMTTRFGLEPVAAWTSIDVGFAPNEHPNLKNTLSSPAIELLAAIGLQRFRPPPDAKSRWAFGYTAWLSPLASSAAAAVAGQSIKTGGKRFVFEVVRRGKFKAVSHADEPRERRDDRP